MIPSEHAFASLIGIEGNQCQCADGGVGRSTVRVVKFE